jgi:hypothetical protein
MDIKNHRKNVIPFPLPLEQCFTIYFPMVAKGEKKISAVLTKKS